MRQPANTKQTGNTMMLGPTGSGKTVYGHFATAHTISTRDGEYMNTLRISGDAFESADDEQIQKHLQALRGNVCVPRNDGRNE